MIILKMKTDQIFDVKNKIIKTKICLTWLYKLNVFIVILLFFFLK